MKLYLITDMEGVAGVYDWRSCSAGSVRYEKCRELLTREVNAAAAGFFEGGISEIEVQIGHHYDSIDCELLDERLVLRNGHCRPVWPWGLDEGFNALAFVGQHAKAGAPFAHLAHTGCEMVIDLRVNGLSIGEYGSLALCAMELGIPTIFASGDEALCREAEALTPGVVTVAGKRGLANDDGYTKKLTEEEYSTVNLGARSLHPSCVRRMLYAGARHAAELYFTNRTSFRYPNLKKPFSLREEYRSKNGEKPFALEATSFSFIVCKNMLRDLIYNPASRLPLEIP